MPGPIYSRLSAILVELLRLELLDCLVSRVRLRRGNIVVSEGGLRELLLVLGKILLEFSLARERRGNVVEVIAEIRRVIMVFGRGTCSRLIR